MVLGRVAMAENENSSPVRSACDRVAGVVGRRPHGVAAGGAGQIAGAGEGDGHAGTLPFVGAPFKPRCSSNACVALPTHALLFQRILRLHRFARFRSAPGQNPLRGGFRNNDHHLQPMKVFISSLITGMEPLRAAAKSAVITLGHDPIMAEDFGALPHSPQVACLNGVRQAGAVVLILGARYGATQPSGLSATHEEYREARDRCPILAFVEDGVTPETKQDAFIREVQAWDSGLIRVGFSNAAQLERKIIQALHRFDVSNAATPFDAKEVLARILALFPGERGAFHGGGAILSVAVAGGPAQAILRPSQIEEPALAETLEKEALYGSVRLFTRGVGTTTSVDDGCLVLEQDSQRSRNGRSLRLDPQGDLLIRLPVDSENHGMGILVETVEEHLAAAVRYAAWVLDHVDPT